MKAEEAVCVWSGEGARACMKGSRMSRHERAALTTDGVSEISKMRQYGARRKVRCRSAKKRSASAAAAVASAARLPRVGPRAPVDGHRHSR